MEKKDKKKCGMETEIYSRVVGFYTPIKRWNYGKQEEFKDRKTYIVKDHDNKEFNIIVEDANKVDSNNIN
ncbi:hypothetical protein KAW80_01780 [Candidatus Babeliales bacterium]|nr:hypothetical protein [Candidatus Babeliales bacterium]